MTRKDLLPILLVPSGILLIPAVAMLTRAEGWNWGMESFVFAWVLMAAVGLSYKLVTRKNVSLAYRVGAGVALGGAFLLLWINGAVGLIGSEDNPANRMYAGVVLIGAVGAALGRFKPLGMARAMASAAAAQFLVPVLALWLRPDDFNPGVAPVFGLNFFFVLDFAASALLFRQAAGPQKETGLRAAA
jgi:hypothetical protein